MKKIYEKYEVENFEELLQHFEMIVLTPMEDLEVDDQALYHSFDLVLKRAKESTYNPLEESMMLKTTFLNSFYGIEAEDITDMIIGMGAFRTHIFLERLLKGHEFYNIYHQLYLDRLSRLNNVGILLTEQGKELLAVLEKFLGELSLDALQDLIKEFEVKAKETGIFDNILNTQKN